VDPLAYLKGGSVEYKKNIYIQLYSVDQMIICIPYVHVCEVKRLSCHLPTKTFASVHWPQIT